MLNLLLDIDIIINLFFIFSKKLSTTDALIMTGITVGLLYVYLSIKNRMGNSSNSD
jgi:hypothetical protein